MTEACFGERLKMMKAMIVPIAATILALTTSAKADNTDHSANYYLPGCRDFANKKFGSDPFLQGECVSEGEFR
jgi:hypothetical protein